MPVLIKPADHIAMAIAEYGGQACALEAFGKQKRSFGFRVGHDAAGKAHALQQRGHLCRNIMIECARPYGVLAFGWNSHKARQILFHGACIKIGLRIRNRLFSGHA